MSCSLGCGRAHGGIDIRSDWTESVRPESTADVVALLNAGVISLVEARRYLGLHAEDATCG
jgi:hypothetical protein